MKNIILILLLSASSLFAQADYSTLLLLNQPTSASPPTFVALIGTNSVTGSGATTAITVADAVASGNQIVVMSTSAFGISSITDTAGRSYSQVYAYSNSSPNFQFWLSSSGGALAISDTITITWAGSGFASKALAAVELQNVTALDIGAARNAFTSSSVVSTNVTASATVALSISERATRTYTVTNSASLLAGISITDTAYTAETFSTSGTLDTGGHLSAASVHTYVAGWFK